MAKKQVAIIGSTTFQGGLQAQVERLKLGFRYDAEYTIIPLEEALSVIMAPGSSIDLLIISGNLPFPGERESYIVTDENQSSYKGLLLFIKRVIARDYKGKIVVLSPDLENTLAGLLVEKLTGAGCNHVLMDPPISTDLKEVLDQYLPLKPNP